MLQKYNRWKVLKVFFNDPNPKGTGFQLREISRLTRLAPTSVKLHLRSLLKEELIVSSKHRLYGYPVYWANRAGERFRFLKKIDTIISLDESGLLDYLSEKCMPDAIVLFGSASRGEDLRDSDVDLFLLCRERNLELQKYEKLLKRKISLHFHEHFSFSKELRNNIINGIILKGYLKVF